MDTLLLGVTDGIQKFFSDAFGGNAWLATIIISFIPLIELKGGILFGSSIQFWGDNALSPWIAYLCGLASGLVIILVLTFLLKPVFSWLKKTKAFKRLVVRLEKSFKKKADKIDDGQQNGAADGSQTAVNQKKSDFKKMLGVLLFVAIPLPLTGVWTGTAIAVFLDLKWWQSILATFAGDVIAGAIIAVVGTLLDEYLDIAFYIILAIAAVVLIAMIVKMVIDSKKEKKAAALNTDEVEPDNSNTEE